MIKKLIGAGLFYGRFFFSFSSIGYFFRQLSWSKDTPDFSGQNWLVTGASGGLGLAAASLAYDADANLTVVGRSQDKLEAVTSDRDSDRWKSLPCDLSLRKDIDQMINLLIRKRVVIDVLVNNVGIMLHEFSKTAEGVETMFATNLLNHFYLTERLIAAEILHKDSVVINITSGGQYMAPLLVEALHNTNAAEHNGTRLYTLQKRAQTVLNSYWQQRYLTSGPTFYVMHPGWADTEGVQTALPSFRKAMRLFLRTPAQGIDTVIWLAHTRPKPTNQLWLDRKARPLHVYKFTQISGNAEVRLIAFLKSFASNLEL